MLRLAHVIDPRAPLPLRRTLRDLHALHQRAVDLYAHLDGDLGEVVAQEHRRREPGALDRQDHAREGFARFKCCVKDVAHFRVVCVRLVEEPCPCARRIKLRELPLLDQCDEVFARLCFRDGWFADEDFPLFWGWWRVLVMDGDSGR